MERLTVRTPDGAAHSVWISQEAANSIMDSVLDRLAEYEDLEEAGQLIRIPCPPGTEVFEIVNNTQACNECDFESDFYGMDPMCTNPDLHFDEDGLNMYTSIQELPVCDRQYLEIRQFSATEDWIFNHREDFNKKWWMTRDAAEAKLDELNKSLGRA